MVEHKKFQFLQLFYLFSAVFMFSFWMFSLAVLIDLPNDPVAITLSIVFPICFVLSILLCRMYYKFYKLKYFFLGKKFEKQLEESKAKFKNADAEFLKDFESLAKRTYRRFGNIFLEDEENLSWIYREKDGIKKIKQVFDKLCKAVESKGGFVEFCEIITNNEDGLNNWTVAAILDLDILSHEIRYLFNQAFEKTNFETKDPGISKLYTDNVERNKELLAEVYSPILFGFEDELKMVAKKLKDNKK